MREKEGILARPPLSDRILPRFPASEPWMAGTSSAPGKAAKIAAQGGSQREPKLGWKHICIHKYYSKHREDCRGTAEMKKSAAEILTGRRKRFLRGFREPSSTV